MLIPFLNDALWSAFHYMQIDFASQAVANRDHCMFTHPSTSCFVMIPGHICQRQMIKYDNCSFPINVTKITQNVV